MRANLGTLLMRRPALHLFAIAVLLAASSRSARADGPDFPREVRPLLARYCFKCHGPDEKTRKAKLRLDVAESAYKNAIVPGKPADSELIARINSDDPAEIMPPPSTKAQLTTAQKQILEDWIKAGAKYQEHWAFVAPRPQAPAPSGRGWSRQPIDTFV